ncbi:hypothetical protein [Cupriavidus campinensis]|uniref:Uncharacterized protein n=1 Tax=Cupriavidus campinensis TaxID=151783 RepID=A0ABY3ESM9_9BURK|nr:hypothetical protein [Cupriavidus campinensis]TSP13978.1 hypothetical protein FGG12_05775 [Cupriavidus campinensis]
MILSIDELEGKALDFAYEKAKAYSEGYPGKYFTWPIKDGVMLERGEDNTYASPDIEHDQIRAMVARHVGELVLVPTDLVSPRHAHARHRRQKEVTAAKQARKQLLSARGA